MGGGQMVTLCWLALLCLAKELQTPWSSTDRLASLRTCSGQYLGHGAYPHWVGLGLPHPRTDVKKTILQCRCYVAGSSCFFDYPTTVDPTASALPPRLCYMRNPTPVLLTRPLDSDWPSRGLCPCWQPRLGTQFACGILQNECWSSCHPLRLGTSENVGDLGFPWIT